MKFTPLEIPDVLLLEPTVFGDERGFFMETWRKDAFEQHAGPTSFVQENHSRSSANVLRGLHYQVRHAQGKLVRVTHGEVFDVAVDMRRSSPCFGKWTGTRLSAEDKRQLWVPPGFAHGFLVLSEQVDFVYKCTDYYAPEFERVLRWNDPALAIDWPLQAGAQPTVSERDAAGDTFADAEYYE
jgi:dTDP-4-dehydrorhamnose 3,5-epimerase